MKSQLSHNVVKSRSNGGKPFCTICHGSDTSLTSHCCGVPMTQDQLEQVHNGYLDYQNDAWVKRVPGK